MFELAGFLTYLFVLALIAMSAWHASSWFIMGKRILMMVLAVPFAAAITGHFAEAVFNWRAPILAGLPSGSKTPEGKEIPVKEPCRQQIRYAWNDPAASAELTNRLNAVFKDGTAIAEMQQKLGSLTFHLKHNVAFATRCNGPNHGVSGLIDGKFWVVHWQADEQGKTNSFRGCVYSLMGCF